jgi:hypothetical protein
MKAVLKWAVVASAVVLGLSACKIESNASVDSDAKVSFTTTYDLSLVLQRMQPVLASLKDADKILDRLNCEGLDPDGLKDKFDDFKCKDVAKGVVVISGSFKGELTNGVQIDENSKEVRVDAVRLFRTVTDIKPPKLNSDQINIGEPPAWLPVVKEKAEQYKNEGASLTLTLTMPAQVVSIDGQEASNVKNNVVTVNFVDIAGKPEYLIVSKQEKTAAWGRWLFIGLGLLLIVAAVLYLFNRQKKSPNKPTTPFTPPMAAESATDAEAEPSSVFEQSHEVKKEQAPSDIVVLKDADELHESAKDSISQVPEASKDNEPPKA